MSSWRWSSKSVEEVGSSRPADLGAKAQLLDEPMSVSQLGLQRRHLLSAVDVAAIIVAVVVVAEEIGVGVAVSVSCGVAVSSLERRSGSAELGRHCCATRAAEAGLRSCRVVAAAAVLVWCSKPRIIIFVIIRVALLLVVVVVGMVVGSVDGVV